MTSKVTDASLSRKFPGYGNPPVNEVVCGVRFRPADGLLIPHIGMLWERLRTQYPVLQHASPIASSKGEMQVDKTTGLPLPRIWFINSCDDQLVQFQKDRFYFNWRKRKSDYPRYPHVIGSFETVFEKVNGVLRDFEIGEIEPVEYELTYINRIPRGMGWETIDDLPLVFSDFVWNKKASRFLPSPADVRWTASFSLPEKRGRLVINLMPAIGTEDELPILVYELKAHGFDSDIDIRDWFDLAHEWIVRGFTDLTTKKMHKIWGLEKNV